MKKTNLTPQESSHALSSYILGAFSEEHERGISRKAFLNAYVRMPAFMQVVSRSLIAERALPPVPPELLAHHA